VTGTIDEIGPALSRTANLNDRFAKDAMLLSLSSIKDYFGILAAGMWIVGRPSQPKLTFQQLDRCRRPETCSATFLDIAMAHNSYLMPLFIAAWWFNMAAGVAEDWWQFRGPNSGHVAEPQVPTTWGGFFHDPVWKSRIPGKGWSSPIVIGDRIWLTSAEEVAMGASKVAERLAQLPFGSTDIVADASVTLFALELDAKNGQLLRRIDLFEHDDPEPIHSMNSYASPTPVTDGRLVVCHFGSLGTACIDIATGSVLWKRELVVEEITGSGASPVLRGGDLYLACDGADEQYVIAIDVLTGKTKWRTDRPEITVVDDSHRRSFSTPLLVDVNGRSQLITMSAQWLVSYNPDDGSEWWRAKVGTGYSSVPTPVFGRDRVFVCTGFTSPEMVAVDTTGNGDVTESAIAWRYTRQVPDVSSPIVVDGEVYFVSSNGIATCLDTDTGELMWQHRVGGHFAASPTYSNGRLYLTSSGGVTTVIKPGREYVELAINELFGETYASLAVFEDSFLLRTNPFLFRLGDSH
jgi:outer membrane protein assembly factor BamB